MKFAHIEFIQKSYFTNFVFEVSKRTNVLDLSEIPIEALNARCRSTQLPKNAIKVIFEQLFTNLSDSEFDSLLGDICKESLVPNLLQFLRPNSSLIEALSGLGDVLKSFYGDSQVSIQFVGKNWWLVRQRELDNKAWFTASEIFTVIMFREILSALTHRTISYENAAIQSSATMIDRINSIDGFQQAQIFSSRPVTAVAIPLYILPESAVINKKNKGSLTIAKIEAANQDDFLRKFKSAIRPYISSGKVTIEFAADLVGIEVRTLQRQIKRCGTTFRNINEELLVDYACQMLLNTTWTSHQIAINLGYSDTSHFARMFKKRMNCSPKQYRDSKISI